MLFDFKKIRTDLLITIGFIIVALAFCYPQLQGKKLDQHDVMSWQCMAHEAMSYHETTGKDALWSNSMFGGMPTYTTYVGATNTNYPAYLQVLLQSIGKPAYFFFIAMFCFYLLLRVLKTNHWLASIGAIAYAFSSYNAIIINNGHDTKMMTLAYLPALTAGLLLIFQEKWLTGAALWGIVLSLVFGNNHFQVIYYTFIMFLCFGAAMLVRAIQEKRVKQFIISCLVAAVTGAIGMSTSLQSVLTTAEYTNETMRGGASELSGHDKKTSGGLDKEYAFRWSNGIGETFCLMIPYLYGGSSGESADKAPKTFEATGGRMDQLPMYWGNQPFVNGPVFFGAIICFLFVLGLMVVKTPHKWWIMAASLICIVLSLGRNLDSVNYFLFDHVPMLNKFRTVTMALVIPEFLFPLLAMLAIQKVVELKKDKLTLQYVVRAAAITAGLCLVVGVGSSMFFSFTGGEDAQLPADIVTLLKQDRASLAVSSGLRSAVLILLAAGLIWLYLKDKLKPVVLYAGLGILVAVDIIPVALDYLNDKSYIDASEYDAFFQPRDVDRQIMRDTDPYFRVLDLSVNTYNSSKEAYFLKLVGGYHPAKMEIYQDLIDRQMSRNFNGQVLNMLNTKYIIAEFKKGAPPMAVPNPGACGNAWFVSQVKWAADADEEMNGLNAPDFRERDTAPNPNAFDPKKTAVIRDVFKNDMGAYTFGKDSTATVKLTNYGLDDLSFASSNNQDGLAVFSDIYYAKGWKAYVDGKETPIMKADYVLRAIKIPAGKHNIEFHFRPSSFYNGQKVAMAGSILLIGLVVAAFSPLAKKWNG